jgi:hypothetical protein
MVRVGRSIDALIDAIELMKYIDSEPRQPGRPTTTEQPRELFAPHPMGRERPPTSI